MADESIEDMLDRHAEMLDKVDRLLSAADDLLSEISVRQSARAGQYSLPLHVLVEEVWPPGSGRPTMDLGAHVEHSNMMWRKFGGK